MERGATSNEIRELSNLLGENNIGKEDQIHSRTSSTIIYSWRATVVSLNKAGPPSTPSSGSNTLRYTDSIKGCSDQSESPLASPASHNSTIKDSEATDSLSNSPRRENLRSSSLKPFISETSLSVDVPECVLLVPKSCYEDFQSPGGIPIISERKAIQALSAAATDPTQTLSEIQLDDFAVYLDRDKFPEEMRSLHHLNTKIGHSSFYVDGVLSIGDTRVYVRRVPIVAVPIGNYGTSLMHTVRDNIWLQSPLSYEKALFYKLGKPAKEYARFFYPFLWVADLAKHFVDFLCTMAENKRKVSIHHFRSVFAAWLKKSYKNSPAFLEWLNQHPSDDYRTSIVANIGFLHKETLGVLNRQKAYSHDIWAEIWEFNSFKAPPTSIDPPTVVTQYIYDCFGHLPFGDRLQVVPLSKETKTLRDSLIRRRHLEFPSKLHQSKKTLSTAVQQRIANIRPGDTISTHRDDVASGSLWERELSKGFSDVDRWFALVQSVHVDEKGVRTFDVIWYYRPVDTLCGLMKYPWNNELFLSDHCSCSEASKIEEDEILGVHDVDFWGTSATTAELFCRQTYLQEERRWITLDESHLQCCHTSLLPEKNHSLKLRSGNTYLLHLDLESPFSEPCEFMSSVREGGQRLYKFRRLLRRRQVDRNARHARPNELVYSEQTCKVSKDRVMSPCFVRLFRDGDKIPTPYDRDGTENLFYITHRQIVAADGVSIYTPLKEAPVSLNQGYDPLQKVQKLRGIDLFCGGGNFGRGLEDGGGIEMKWANDYNAKAIHTYMANVSKPEAVHPFLGSIDDLQLFAMQGRFADNVPHIGDVDFVSGGSPCPGFSRLTNDKTTAAQRKNQSLVAAFASFVDLYRPKYGVLENVPGMIHKKESRDQDVFSQLICSLVGLGYQTQFFFLDASSCGSPQRRSRIFVVFAAPGLELPKKPVQTHSHPPKTHELGIGWLPNGQHMATRGMPVATPFKYMSAEEATADLPSIHDAKPDICVPYPDHRSPSSLTKMMRARVAAIPVRPWGINFAQAWYGEDKAQAGSGTMTLAERELFLGTREATGSQPMSMQPQSRAYGRMFPNKLFDTITTRPITNDAKNGRLLHWRENRLISIMEARRAQGFRDEEVLLGDPLNQYRIVGNSVARQIAVALGVTFREAWVTSLKRNRELERVNNRGDEEVKSSAENVAAYVSIRIGEVGDGISPSTRLSRSSTLVAQSTRESTPLGRADKVRTDGVRGSTGTLRDLVGNKRLCSTSLVVEIPQFLKRRKLDTI